MNSSKKSFNQAMVLQVAAIVVAAPRYMGAFAAALGIDLVSHWPYFADVEIASGAAMALVEGLAVAFVFRRWRSMRTGSTQWKISLALQIALIITLPLVATPYLLASQLYKPVGEIMPFALLAMWSFIVAAIAPLVLAAVGYTDIQPATRDSTIVVESKSRAIGKPAQAIDVPILSSFECDTCHKIYSTHQALNAHKRFCAGVSEGTIKWDKKAVSNGNGNG
jgi:hypothetical protein